MLFDKADWHYDSAKKYYCEKFNKTVNFLTDEDEEIIWQYAGNHIAFFLTWLIMRDLLGKFHFEDDNEKCDLEAVKERKKTGMEIFNKYCDMRLTDEDISKEIMPFVEEYYDKEYFRDYYNCMGEEKTLACTFSWDDYFMVEEALDMAYKKYLGKGDRGTAPCL